MKEGAIRVLIASGYDHVGKLTARRATVTFR